MGLFDFFTKSATPFTEEEMDEIDAIEEQGEQAQTREEKLEVVERSMRLWHEKGIRLDGPTGSGRATHWTKEGR